tara:strand:+ start:36550 stop:37125 length:576 start_codon:yes stop_codon:yes gene_type:complete
MKKILVFLFFVTFWKSSKAQLIERISLAGSKESTALPFTRSLPIHPGGEIVLTFNEKKREKSITSWNLGIGGFHHKKIANAFYLKGEYHYRPIIKSTLTIDIVGNLGYMHTFYPGEVYELNKHTGDFEKITQYGRPHVLAGVGIGITYIKSENIHPFIRQELAIESPFANGIPVMIHSFVKIGISYQLNSK